MTDTATKPTLERRMAGCVGPWSDVYLMRDIKAQLDRDRALIETLTKALNDLVECFSTGVLGGLADVSLANAVSALASAAEHERVKP
jgi:hypothetical protein